MTTTTTRRDFVKGGATVAAGITALGALGVPAFSHAEPSEVVWDSEADIIVLGCGSGGAAGALDAYDAGNSVIIVEKQTWLGGTMRRSGGGIAAAGTCVQKALGVEDNADDFYNYMVACGNGLVDEEMLRVFADRAASDFDWYVQDIAGQTEADWCFTNGTDGQEVSMRHGLNLSGMPVYFDKYGFTPVPRVYWFEANPDDYDDGYRMYAPASLLGRPDYDTPRGGTGLWKPMQDAIDARDFEIHTGTSLVSFIVNTDGEVIGVRCRDLLNDQELYFKANKGVLLATGSFERNDQMLFDYCLHGWQAEKQISNVSFTDDGGASDALTITTGWANPNQEDGVGILAAMAIGAGTQVMAAGPWRGGLITDTNAQVIDSMGNPIPRLYASSFAVGGKWGLHYSNCGLQNMWNIVYSRIAAENLNKLEPITNYDAILTHASGGDNASVTPLRTMDDWFGPTAGGATVDQCKDGTWTGSAEGVGGILNVTIEVKDGKLAVVEIGPNNETPAIGGYEAIEDGYFATSIEEAQGIEFDAATNATVTSNVVKLALQRAMDQAAQ